MYSADGGRGERNSFSQSCLGIFLIMTDPIQKIKMVESQLTFMKCKITFSAVVHRGK